jgi:Calx-beta domain
MPRRTLVLPRNACDTGGSTYAGSPERARSWSVRAIGPVAAGIAWLVFAVVVVRAQSVDNRIEASPGGSVLATTASPEESSRTPLTRPDAALIASDWADGAIPAPSTPKPAPRETVATEIPPNQLVETPEGSPVLIVEAAANVSEDDDEVVVTIGLSKAVDSPIAVIYSTLNGAALGGTDYQPERGTLSLTDDTRRSRLQIRLVDDDKEEGDENFYIFTIATPSRVMAVARKWISVTIRDNDGPSALDREKVSSSEQPQHEGLGTRAAALQPRGSSPQAAADPARPGSAARRQVASETSVLDNRPTLPTGDIRVFIHHVADDRGDAALARRLADHLRRQGFAVAGIRSIDFSIGKPSVRYFFACDRAASRRLVEEVRRFFEETPSQAPDEASDFTHFMPKPRPGNVEVWLPAS